MKHCYGFTCLSDRVKLREFKNDKLLLCLQYMMIKFESYLAINNNNNKSNAAIIQKIRLTQCLYSCDYSIFTRKKIIKMVCCCIVCSLKTKPISTFGVGDRIKAKPMEGVTYNPLGHSKCDKICHMDCYIKQTREKTNF